MVHETKNQVLQTLPSPTRDPVLEACERKQFKSMTTLASVGEPVATVYFPETAVISTLATYKDGSRIEMANIGREACTGIGLILGHPIQLNTDEVQVSGSALVMSADKFVNLKSTLPEFQSALFSTIQAVLYQIMVSGACNGAHTAKQRLARWLLTMSDRNDSEEIHLTQEFLAEILGVRRATVTHAATELMDAGLIEYMRGRIRITDHSGLREASCECYSLVRDAYALLLPGRTR